MTAQPAATTHEISREADTRARILATARDLFLRNGYAGTSTAAIGKALGISAPALYWHFPSKEAILFALIEERLADFIRIVDSDHSRPAQRLAELVRKYVQVQLSEHLDAAGYSSLMNVAQSAHVLTPEHQHTLKAMQREIYQRFLTTLRDGHEAGHFHLADPVATTFAIIAICEHVTNWVRPDGRLAPAAIADEYVVLTQRMVGTQTH